ncbi:multidrug effflux MFS transporter [Actinotalea sp. M2MS4P-6]|uniref:multidrug effflux MFS transporter n=1 Tax=Actinotalea sp. M2MS4P-6 TaxID=2983762 RepID=UPI0021E37160|nr:multidrug effflux MFS transporter [Actinotalea sp. M2MS4P-6]MCV2394338.1 multidrug effflux MFS transporter [Actinotalea sp. M2MS4P-6]
MTTEAVARYPGEEFSVRRRIAHILVLGGLVAFGPFTIDLYLPAFPAVAADLATSEAAIQFTLTATTVGFGLGQLVVGPLSDAVGRRRPLLVATTVHVVASLGIMLAPTVGWVMVGRVAQGVGAAGSAVVAMAVVRDLFGGQPLVRMLARMALVTGLAPILAPVIGSQLLLVVDWRGIFAVLAGYGLLMMLVSAGLLGETLPPANRHGSGRRAIGERYRALARDRVFVGSALVGAMGFGSMFAYLASSSFLYQEDFGLSAQQYGALFATNAVGIVISAQVAGRLMRRYPPTWVMAGSLTIILVSSAGLLVAGWLDSPPAVAMVLIFVTIAALGGVNPSVQVTALSRHGARAGTAASLLGAFNFVLAGLISPVVGALGVSVTSMASVMVAVLVLAHLCLWLVVRPWTVAVVA